jgi:YicC-like family, N-terminal region
MKTGATLHDLPVGPVSRYISWLSRAREFAVPLSMTGFGAGEGPVAGGRLRIEIRTVNHRYFNLAARLPTELLSLEAEVRERLRHDFDRGHLALQAR